MAQIRTIRSSQETEISTLKSSINEVKMKFVFFIRWENLFFFVSLKVNYLFIVNVIHKLIKKNKQFNNYYKKKSIIEIMSIQNYDKPKFETIFSLSNNWIHLFFSKILTHSMSHVLNFNNILSKLKMNEWLKNFHSFYLNFMKIMFFFKDFLQKIKEIEFERESLSIQYHSISKTLNDVIYSFLVILSIFLFLFKGKNKISNETCFTGKWLWRNES
jgi:hypothetical protein